MKILKCCQKAYISVTQFFKEWKPKFRKKLFQTYPYFCGLVLSHCLNLEDWCDISYPGSFATGLCDSTRLGSGAYAWCWGSGGQVTVVSLRPNKVILCLHLWALLPSINNLQRKRESKRQNYCFLTFINWKIIIQE